MLNNNNNLNILKERLLILKIRRGDTEAFRKIYQIFADKIYKFIYYRISNREASLELSQEVFLALWKYLSDKEKEITNLRGLTYQIARNLINNYYDANKVWKVDLEEVEYKLGVSIDLGQEFDLKISIKELKSKLQVLESDEDRRIIELKFFDGLSHNEIAEVVGKSSGNVRVILHRALKKLKEIYKKWKWKGFINHPEPMFIGSPLL